MAVMDLGAKEKRLFFRTAGITLFADPDGEEEGVPAALQRRFMGMYDLYPEGRSRGRSGPEEGR